MTDELLWSSTPLLLENYLRRVKPVAFNRVKEGGSSFWWNADTEEILEGVPQNVGRAPWVPVKCAEAPFRPIFDALQLTPNPVNNLVGGPTPLAAMLAGGALSAGIGYGGGYLAEKIMGPKVLTPGRLRRNLAIAGGLIGTIPGAYLGSVGARINAEDGKPPMDAFVEPNVLFGKEGEDYSGGFMEDSIPVDSFNRVVWSDPFTPIGLRAATTGLIEGASQMQGGARLISPMDVGRIAMGMGSGMLSGMAAGKVLGLLAGMTPEAQKTLQSTGMWAGAIANVVPKVFGL